MENNLLDKRAKRKKMSRAERLQETKKNIEARLSKSGSDDRGLTQINKINERLSSLGVEAVEVTLKCQATTKAGNPCKNNALEGSKYCGTHKDYQGD